MSDDKVSTTDTVETQAEDTAPENAALAAMTAQLREKDSLIEKLRTKEKEGEKALRRLTRQDAIIDSVLGTLRAGVPETVTAALANLAKEQQYDILSALVAGRQPVEPVEPALDAQPTQIPRPQASPIQTPYEAEKQELIRQGRWSSAAALTLAQKHRGGR